MDVADTAAMLARVAVLRAATRFILAGGRINDATRDAERVVFDEYCAAVRDLRIAYGLPVRAIHNTNAAPAA